MNIFLKIFNKYKISFIINYIYKYLSFIPILFKINLCDILLLINIFFFFFFFNFLIFFMYAFLSILINTYMVK